MAAAQPARYQTKAQPLGRWLLGQAGRRDDAIGALALAAKADRGFPKDGDYEAISRRLNELAGRWRHARGAGAGGHRGGGDLLMRVAPRPRRPRTFVVDGQFEYRVCAFGEPRGPWRFSHEQAKWDAISKGLASYDAELGEYYLAVPVDIERRRIALELAA